LEFTFQLAKNNENTVKADNYFLHSSYNPSKEAERFVENITLPFNAKYLIIIEPALSYCLPFLKKKFPETKIIVLRLFDVFSDYNKGYDSVINYYEHTSNFLEYLQNIFTEEELLKTFIVNWTNSQNVFKELFTSIVEDFSVALNNSKTQLITRQYFEKKWLLNSIKNSLNISNCVQLSGNINKPVLIISSGPSLKSILSFLPDIRNKFFIICLSSAISVCTYNNIIPDLYMTTDGGFWAGQHLKKLNSKVPLAFPLEAYIPTDILLNNPLIPFTYKDSLINSFVKKDIKFLVRNGTVTGTALQFALSLNSLPVFMAGVDMSEQKGFQHTQPNELELNNSIFDNNLYSKELRLTRSEFNSGSLNIYLQWFKNFNCKERKVYRIIETDKTKNNLGQIKDLSPSDFLSISQTMTEDNPSYKFVNETFENPENSFKLNLKNAFYSEKWIEQLFPLDLVSLSHNPDNLELKNKLNERTNNLYNKIEKLIND